MPPHRPTRAGRVISTLALLATLTPGAAGGVPAPGAQRDDASRLRLQALDLAYNLDHDEAIALLRKAVAAAPDDPAPHRSLAAVVWLNLLFRRGAVTVDHYLGSFTKPKIDLKKPPPELDAEFRRHINRAIDLSRQRVAARPKDAQGHYDLGAALGLDATYVATVEGKMMDGLRASRHAFDAHERVMELDGSRKDGGLIVGTYRYIVSTLPFALRWMAYVVGFGGGRERGIQLLEQTAASPSDVQADAMFALILIYNREKRYDDAVRVVQTLRGKYPRNRLVVLEAGATALRAGRAQQAEDLLTAGLAMFAKDTRAKIPGEEALWRYKRGSARATLGRVDDAAEDLRAATTRDPQLWVQGRARVELGRLALKRGDRAAAVAEAQQAQTLCQQGNDRACVDEARKLSRSAHGR